MRGSHLSDLTTVNFLLFSALVLLEVHVFVRVASLFQLTTALQVSIDCTRIAEDSSVAV